MGLLLFPSVFSCICAVLSVSVSPATPEAKTNSPNLRSPLPALTAQTGRSRCAGWWLLLLSLSCEHFLLLLLGLTGWPQPGGEAHKAMKPLEEKIKPVLRAGERLRVTNLLCDTSQLRKVSQSSDLSWLLSLTLPTRSGLLCSCFRLSLGIFSCGAEFLVMLSSAGE